MELSLYISLTLIQLDIPLADGYKILAVKNHQKSVEIDAELPKALEILGDFKKD